MIDACSKVMMSRANNGCVSVEMSRLLLQRGRRRFVASSDSICFPLLDSGDADNKASVSLVRKRLPEVPE